VKLIFEKLEVLGDPLLKSRLIGPLRNEIARNPDQYMSLLFIDVKDVRPKSRRSLVSIMISKGKGASFDPNHEQPVSIGNTNAKPIGFTSLIQKQQNLSCVGVAS
jgi:hypothetical protein